MSFQQDFTSTKKNKVLLSLANKHKTVMINNEIQIKGSTPAVLDFL